LVRRASIQQLPELTFLSATDYCAHRSAFAKQDFEAKSARANALAKRAKSSEV
jgi:hypothetical protein